MIFRSKIAVLLWSIRPTLGEVIKHDFHDIHDFYDFHDFI